MVAPICLFVFNRPQHTLKTLTALKANSLANKSQLYIFCDGPRNANDEANVAEVRALLRNLEGFASVSVIESSPNKGLANSVIGGVTEVLKNHDRVIVLEDDLVTSPFFLEYMNDGLELYANEPRVASIHGYLYPVQNPSTAFFIRGSDCWGWATWARAWKEFNADGSALLSSLQQGHLEKLFNFANSTDYIGMLKDQIAKKNKSWAIRWYASTFLKNMYTLWPPHSLVQNIGMDSSGTNCDSTERFDVQLATEKIQLVKQEIIESETMRERFELYFRSTKVPLHKRAFNKLKRLVQSL